MAQSNLIGIELLNEPHPTTNQGFLLDFYQRGIEQVQSAAPDVLVIVSDAFRPREWSALSLPDTANVALDVHLYQAFDEADKKLLMHKHIRKAKDEWSNIISDVQQAMPVIVGEWSLGLDNGAFRGMDDFERDKALQAYAAAQMNTFADTMGWFFWTYKAEAPGGWNYVDAVKRGWLPCSLVQ